MDAYQDVKKRLNENKAIDPDDITAEIFKHCNLDEIIQGFVAKITNKIILNRL